MVDSAKPMSELFGYLTRYATLQQPGAVSAQANGIESYLGTPVVNGTLAPSGLVYGSYTWSAVHKGVILFWQALYSTAGTLVTDISFPFPPDVPAPFMFTGQPKNQWVLEGSGGVYAQANVLANGQAKAGIWVDTVGNLSLKCSAGVSALSAKYLTGNVCYIIP